MTFEEEKAKLEGKLSSAKTAQATESKKFEQQSELTRLRNQVKQAKQARTKTRIAEFFGSRTGRALRATGRGAKVVGSAAARGTTATVSGAKSLTVSAISGAKSLKSSLKKTRRTHAKPLRRRNYSKKARKQTGRAMSGRRKRKKTIWDI